MFQIIQSNDTDTLVDQLIEFYQKNDQYGSLSEAIFSPFTVIVPSMVLGNWLTKEVAMRAGISTLLIAQFWGQYQWRMIDKVLGIDAKNNEHDAVAVPEVAVLSASVMRWRLFGFLNETSAQLLEQIIDDETHVLHLLFKPLSDKVEDGYVLEPKRLWQACDELSKVYVRYLTHRPEWLHAWSFGLDLPVSVEEMIRQKDKFGDEFGRDDETPSWLLEHYESLERLLRFLWQTLFFEVYEYREMLERRFWAVLDGERGEATRQQAINALPKDLYLFTVQQMPQVELLFLKRLSLVINVHLLHFNPSRMFWADIVDKNWLMTQKIIRPNAVYLKDYGHGLLSRLGKESRETFAMLADMSGGEFYYQGINNSDINDVNKSQQDDVFLVDWQDRFIPHTGKGILSGLKQDILMLGEGDGSVAMDEMLSVLGNKTHQKPTMTLTEQSNYALPELSIHACHSLKRQLEIARTMIAKYLNTEYADGKRQLSDVVILLPDVDVAQNVIHSVFPEGVGIDGMRLPVKITGITDRSIDELMTALTGFYRLLGAKDARFYAEEFYEWLMNPAVYENFSLSFDEAYRARELLGLAGFKRGFNAEHLSQTLHDEDTDYRYTFSYALDRIVMGFIAPDAQHASDVLYPFDWQNVHTSEATLPLGGIGLDDEPIVSALCRMYEALGKFGNDYQKVDTAQAWLHKIESEVIDTYFSAIKQSVQMRSIFDAKNAMLSSLRANTNYYKRTHHQGVYVLQDDIRLSLEFVLDSLTAAVGMQTISAEPSGVITVARFGALRNIPFGLTIMLGMDLSAFPRQDRNTRLDLMKAGLKRRGDRTNEDDDNGAFLDALLCTKDACAIFYNGMSPDGSTVLLPASPVGELIEFLKSEVYWQVDDVADEALMALGGMLPELIARHLVTYHHAMNFEQGVFYQAKDVEADDDFQAYLNKLIDAQKHEQRRHLPPAPIWQKVRRVIDEYQEGSATTLVALPTDDEMRYITDVLMDNLAMDQQNNARGQSVDELLDKYRIEVPNYLSIKNMLYVIKSPAKAYLKGKFALDDEMANDEANEPLSLDYLGGWQLHQMILQAFRLGVFDGMPMNAINPKTLSDVINNQQNNEMTQLHTVHHDALLPAGAVRMSVLQDGLDFVVGQLEAMLGELGETLNRAASPDDWQYSKVLSGLEEQTVAMTLGSHRLKLMADMPKTDETVWKNMSVSRASAERLIDFWLHHLLWQVHRQTNEKDEQLGYGRSIWRFKEASQQLKALKNLAGQTTYELSPVRADKASKLLQNFIIFTLLGSKLPIILTPINALLMARLQGDTSSIGSAWVNEIYALMIGDSDPEQVLTSAGQLSEPLYEELLKNIRAFGVSDEQ
ncbi:exodeoxyribonuclease V subunit gamma [Moraxella haemolytica]|uniref:exodeoxyribonuclease V subunit gamma n=1 Tax=Moraxella haemolytica TaxID=2904119 RepID=UPI002543CB0B|nr:exodeoxyribonuclease V subunit gamma [Moraxella sp. ZY171148]WII95924.1 exodeoxyribonuclease V subunit gamma [Moraxella sp. ZY171148]